jgi:hypothetical protein
MSKSPSKRSRHRVYVVGAGFSAGLGYPLVNDLLIRLWPRLDSDLQESLRKVIEFHHPGFASSRETSFPNIETLLSEMIANEDLFKASRVAPGGFKLKDLRRVRRGLLLAIVDWFHEIADDYKHAPPAWLLAFADHVKRINATVVSFNWDLVLESLLFDEGASPNYGLDEALSGPVLLKPHGSLNWFTGLAGTQLKSEHKQLLHQTGDRAVFRFRHFRAPRGKRSYMPLIIPPTFNKRFARPIFQDLWRKSVSELARAGRVTFLGYSLPEADLHARFILRFGFDNQEQGVPLPSGTRAIPPGPAITTIVNPDIHAARRIESTVGKPCKWKPMFVKDWAETALRQS